MKNSNHIFPSQAQSMRAIDTGDHSKGPDNFTGKLFFVLYFQVKRSLKYVSSDIQFVNIPTLSDVLKNI